MTLNQAPYQPSTEDLHKNGKNFPPNFLHKSWMDYLYWDVELRSLIIFSDILIAIFEPVLIILSKIE